MHLCVLAIAGLLSPILGGAIPANAAATAVASSSSGSSSSRTSISLNRPAGTAAGHVMVASIVSNDDYPGFTAPAGWSVVSDRSITDVLRQAVYVKVAGPSEPTAYTWGVSDFRRLAGGITTYADVDAAGPVDAVGTSVNSTASATVTAPSITTTVPDTRLVQLVAVNSQGTVSPPADMTERWEARSPNLSSARDALAASADTVHAPAGATGARVATASAAGRSIGTLLALRPAGPASPPDGQAPETTITSGPTGTVTSSSATFAFTADEPATFRCSLDGAAPTNCTSPRSYSNLANGPHTFAVAATDIAGNPDPTPDTRSWTVNAPAVPPVLVGAGDISGCSSPGDGVTASLLDGIPGTVFTTGDNVYNDGSASRFADCYHPTWGRHKARTLPSAGNHDYMTPGAAGYFGYFGAAAGDPTKGYYDTTIGSWHVVVLNSNCAAIGGCGAGSPQEQWLRGVLAASTAPCTVAIWHHARFSSGQNHGSNPAYQPFWQALYDYGAEVVVNGHDHLYERFGRQGPTGVADAVAGIRQFTVGTGGINHYSFGTIRPNSEVRNSNTFGVLKLTLHPDRYDWQFVPEAGRTFTDAGTTACHGAPNAPPPPPPPPPPPGPGPIAPVGSSSSGSSSSRTGITLNRPAGTVPGHVMVASIMSNDDDPGFAAPPGWTPVSDRSIRDALRQAVYVKVAGASEPATYTWTLSEFRRVAGGITTYSGVDTADPVDAVAASVNTASSTAVTAPSITTTAADARVVHLAAINAEATLAAPADMTEQWEARSPNLSSTRDVSGSASDRSLSVPSATGPRSATSNRPGVSIGVMLALRAAAPEMG
jgi:hypothetical protein